MTTYVAFLRGITPSNPRMSNENLRDLFNGLGFTNVETVISSGNVIFETKSQNPKILENILQETLQDKLGISGTTFIRTKDELDQLVHRNPFSNIEDTRKSKLNVTFTKKKVEYGFKFNGNDKYGGFKVFSIEEHTLGSIIDLTVTKTPTMMQWLEEEFGKDVTTRTWKTMGRIVKRIDK